MFKNIIGKLSGIFTRSNPILTVKSLTLNAPLPPGDCTIKIEAELVSGTFPVSLAGSTIGRPLFSGNYSLAAYGDDDLYDLPYFTKGAIDLLSDRKIITLSPLSGDAAIASNEMFVPLIYFTTQSNSRIEKALDNIIITLADVQFDRIYDSLKSGALTKMTVNSECSYANYKTRHVNRDIPTELPSFPDVPYEELKSTLDYSRRQNPPAERVKKPRPSSYSPSSGDAFTPDPILDPVSPLGLLNPLNPLSPLNPNNQSAPDPCGDDSGQVQDDNGYCSRDLSQPDSSFDTSGSCSSSTWSPAGGAYN